MRSILAKTNFKGETTSSNPDFFETVCHPNITLMVNTIRHHSPILKEMEDKGAIKIVDAIYDIPSGKVEFFAYCHANNLTLQTMC